MDLKKAITIKEAAGRLRCGRKFIRVEIRRGNIRAARINSRLVFIDSDSFAEYERSKTEAQKGLS